jgi:hypothetical protein
MCLLCFKSDSDAPSLASNPNEGEIAPVKAKSIGIIPQIRLKLVNEMEDAEYEIDIQGLKGSKRNAKDGIVYVGSGFTGTQNQIINDIAIQK